jgi:murein L,D-transpeptidase YafK
VVDKTRQELQIWMHDGSGGITLERIIPCSTGTVRGDKLVRGDQKTPDGFYVFNEKLLPHELPEIYGILAYPMDYPNLWDRLRDHGGSGIWTHGVNKPLVDYDSNGCVELFNHDIAGLEDRIVLFDTPILLYETMVYAPRERLRAEGRKVAAFVEGWRAAWAGKDLERYGALYAPGFMSSDGMNRDAWLANKRNVAAGYRNIRIAVDDLRVFRHREVLVAAFTQLYDGDGRYSSAGTKRLYLTPEGDGYRIVAEDFEGPRSQDPLKRLDPRRKREAMTRPPLAVASFSNPVAAAGAGAILPGMPAPVVTASLPQRDDTQDELDRSALEAMAAGRPSPGGSEDAPEPQKAPGDGEPVILTASLDTGATDASGPAAPASGGTSSGPAAAPPAPRADSRPAGAATRRNPSVTGSLAGPAQGPGTAIGTLAGTPPASRPAADETLLADASGTAPAVPAAGGSGRITSSVSSPSPSTAPSASSASPSAAPSASSASPSAVSSASPSTPSASPSSSSAASATATAPAGAASPSFFGQAAPGGTADITRPGAAASPTGTASAQPGTAPAGAAGGGAGTAPGTLPAPEAVLVAQGPAAPAASAAVPADGTVSGGVPAPAAAPADPEEARDSINDMLGGWVGAWEEKDLERFFAFYADDFRFPDRGMDRGAFVKYRTNLINRAGSIDVELEGVEARLGRGGGTATVTFVQRYSSDSYSDSGDKTLKLAFRDGGWKIVSETFRAARGGR